MLHKPHAFCAVIAFMLLASCASAPPATPAAVANLDTSFTHTTANAEPEHIATFWQQFKDPALSTLIERALSANTDLKLATARLQEARANAGETGAARWPSLNLGASAASLDPACPKGSSCQFGLNAVFNWELDFWGRNQAAHTASAALVQAADAGIGAAQRLLTAELSQTYLSLRGTQQRLIVTQSALDNQREALRIVTQRAQLGRSTALDVSRASALLHTTEAALPLLQAQLERSTYRLATLTAMPPRELQVLISEPRLLPTLPTTDLSAMPVGTPQTLLERRPDIRAAAAQLRAASSNTDVIRADRFPRINLTGLIGFANNRIADLLQSDSRATSVGAALSWNLLDFGRIRSRIKGSEARAEQALQVYAQTVQLALEETEGALSQFNRSQEQTVALHNAARASEEAARLARIRFDVGVSDFLTVLDAERTTLQTRDALVQAQTNTASALVLLYRALGGGWSVGPSQQHRVMP
jgi:outer membrane protein, multidrug efflux system